MKKSINFVKRVCGMKTKEETKREENVFVLEEIKEETTRPVFDLLEILTQRVQDEALTIEFSKGELFFLESLIKNNPVFFKDIHEEIEKIIRDRTINIHDIPEIVLLLSQIFHIHFVENCIEDFGIVNIIQFIIECILDSGLFHINDVDIEILKRVVKTSLSLLKMNVTIEKEIVCCQSWFVMRMNQ
jgi:hypothetical protein